ncbi:hypothetical protein BDK51DRAFT_51059 [Blyttiomyces helicus]|uniref:Uncharacterized protein n=1 Tax=Blyttiomyces helicus TaxID=388810 RepID=A0A4P9W8G9_9FUNG|nr:hypothetical protein BDK51DRAFT_51059 [Blyttiomyces helicus]|eukprot:RKO87753.1 hypothetical protein BDK51DRAFT_51059 [Blyttiomyces helicus]
MPCWPRSSLCFDVTSFGLPGPAAASRAEICRWYRETSGLLATGDAAGSKRNAVACGRLALRRDPQADQIPRFFCEVQRQNTAARPRSRPHLPPKVNSNFGSRTAEKQMKDTESHNKHVVMIKTTGGHGQSSLRSINTVDAAAGIAFLRILFGSNVAEGALEHVSGVGLAVDRERNLLHHLPLESYRPKVKTNLALGTPIPAVLKAEFVQAADALKQMKRISRAQEDVSKSTQGAGVTPPPPFPFANIMQARRCDATTYT